MYISTSGARAGSSSASFYRLHNLEVTAYQDKTSLCILSAICNSLHLLGVQGLADKYWAHFKENSWSFVRYETFPRCIRDFRDVNKPLNRKEVVLRHLSGSVPTIARLLDVEFGVFVVTLVERANKPHTVCISSKDHIILDCIELYPMSFSLQDLKIFLGNGVRLLEIHVMQKVCLVRASATTALSASTKPRNRRKLKAEGDKSK